MRRGQGSLEYLLILAAILAIAVVVVLIANSMLGSPKDVNTVNQDKYNFALQGWEIKGYNNPIDVSDTAESAPESFNWRGDSYSYNPAAPPADATEIGVLQDREGNTYTVYTDEEGNYYIDQGQDPECGDTVVQVGEECDPPEGVCTAAYGESCDWCNSTCQYETVEGAYCGDGIQDAEEDCTCVDYSCPTGEVCDAGVCVGIVDRDANENDCLTGTDETPGDEGIGWASVLFGEGTPDCCGNTADEYYLWHNSERFGELSDYQSCCDEITDCVDAPSSGSCFASGTVISRGHDVCYENVLLRCESEMEIGRNMTSGDPMCCAGVYVEPSTFPEWTSTPLTEDKYDCGDGSDNDCDTLIDCEDDDCPCPDGEVCDAGVCVTAPDTEPPSAVSNLKETHTDTTVTLSWDAATDDMAVDHYNIYRNGLFVGTNTSDLGYGDTGLSRSTTYEYTVTAVDTSDNEGPGTTITVTTSTLVLAKSCSPGMDRSIDPDYKEIITMLSPLSNLRRVSLEPAGSDTRHTATFEKRAADNTLLESQTITSPCIVEGWCDHDLDPPMSFNTDEKLIIKQGTWVEIYSGGDCDDADFDIKIKYIQTYDEYDWMLRLYTLSD